MELHPIIKPLSFHCIAFSAIATILACPTRAGAAPLASDDFNTYAVGNIEFQNDGTGWAFGYVVGSQEGFLNDVRTSNPLSYPNYPSVGGNYANVAAGYGGPTFNFIQRTLDVADEFAAYFDGTRIGADNTTLWGSFVYNNVNGMQFILQGADNTNTFTMPISGSNSLFLYRIQFGANNADTITVWSNPDLATWTPSATPTSTSTGDLSFQTLVFVAPNDTNEGRFDNVRLGSEAVDVVPVTSSSTPYVTWALSKNLDPLTDGAPGFDKDNDGATNLEEYAFFTDPKSGSSLPSMITANNASQVTLAYLRANAATDVTYTAESSINLSDWGPATSDTAGTVTANTTEYLITAPKVNPATFLRIRVNLPVSP